MNEIGINIRFISIIRHAMTLNITSSINSDNCFAYSITYHNLAEQTKNSLCQWQSKKQLWFRPSKQPENLKDSRLCGTVSSPLNGSTRMIN